MATAKQSIPFVVPPQVVPAVCSRNASWKGVTERLAYRFKLDGKAFCARVLAATKPTPSISIEIS